MKRVEREAKDFLCRRGSVNNRRLISLGLLILSCNAACSMRNYNDIRSAPNPIFQGDPSLPQCGFEMLPDKYQTPADPCDSGSIVISEQLLARARGKPVEEVRYFSVAEAGSICVQVKNISSSSALLELDESVLISPNKFNPRVRSISAIAQIQAGSHTLSIRVASAPGSAVSMEVRFSPKAISYSGLTTGEKGKLSVWDLFDDPDPISPFEQDTGGGTATLGVTAGVEYLDGGPGFEYRLHYLFEIVEPKGCSLIRSLPGKMSVECYEDITRIPLRTVGTAGMTKVSRW